MPIDRLELLYTPGYESLANRVKNDLAGVSPLTEVRLTSIVTHGVSRRNR
jgi:transcriptional regulatory protein RtcR